MPEPRRTLASDLRAGESNLRDVERRVEAFLTQLFPRWKGWAFTAPATIDVYQVQDSPEAARALHAQGFDAVVLHNHQAARFLSCACRPREVSP